MTSFLVALTLLAAGCSVLARLKVSRGPLLIVAGDADQVTPVSLSRKLLGAALDAPESLPNYGKFLAIISGSP